MMTDQEVVDTMRGDSPLNRARRVFSAGSARIEQANLQRRPPDAIEMRRMEFEAVEEILKALGISLQDIPDPNANRMAGP